MCVDVGKHLHPHFPRHFPTSRIPLIVLSRPFVCILNVLNLLTTEMTHRLILNNTTLQSTTAPYRATLTVLLLQRADALYSLSGNFSFFFFFFKGLKLSFSTVLFMCTHGLHTFKSGCQEGDKKEFGGAVLK